MELYDGQWATKEGAWLYKIMDGMDNYSDARQAEKAGRSAVCEHDMTVFVLGLPPTAGHWNLRRMLLRCEPTAGKMEEEEATWLVQLTAGPKQMLTRFLDMSKERHLPITLRFEPDGNVQAACLRTIWRYLAFHKYEIILVID